MLLTLLIERERAGRESKQRSALHQEVPNKDREMETHRNRSLWSHELIRNGGARFSGKSAVCCTDGEPVLNVQDSWGATAKMICLSKVFYCEEPLIFDRI